LWNSYLKDRRRGRKENKAKKVVEPNRNIVEIKCRRKRQGDMGNKFLCMEANVDREFWKDKLNKKEEEKVRNKG
jgi:hypothetical protein